MAREKLFLKITEVHGGSKSSEKKEKKSIVKEEVPKLFECCISHER